MSTCLAAIDFGTGAVRSVIFDTHGEQLGSAYREIAYESVPGDPMGACQFAGDAMWQTIGGVVRASLRAAGVQGGDVRAVSTTSQRHGIALVDAEGRTLYAGPNRDARGWGLEFPDLDPREIYERNGRQPIGILAPFRLRWFRDHRPEVLERASSLLMINDWVVYQLCGQATCADSGAAESLLLDLRTLDWSAELASAFDVPLELLPPVVRGGDIVGEVLEEAAELTGLAPGTPVVAGGGDSQCAMLACQAVHAGEIGVIAGTTAPVMAVTHEPRLDPEGRAWTGVHVPPGSWVYESNAGSAGTLLRWFRDEFGRPDASQSFEELLQPADAIRPGADGLMALLNAPTFDASRPIAPHRGFVFAPGAFIPMEAVVTRGHFGRALLEGIAYTVTANYRRLVELSGKEPSRVALCGGCAQSPLFVEIMASVLGQPIVSPRSGEAAALGAAICAATGAGLYGSLEEASAAMAQIQMVAEPDPARVETYTALYEEWCGVAAGLARME